MTEKQSSGNKLRKRHGLALQTQETRRSQLPTRFDKETADAVLKRIIEENLDWLKEMSKR